MQVHLTSVHFLWRTRPTFCDKKNEIGVISIKSWNDSEGFCIKILLYSFRKWFFVSSVVYEWEKKDDISHWKIVRQAILDCKKRWRLLRSLSECLSLFSKVNQAKSIFEQYNIDPLKVIFKSSWHIKQRAIEIS